MINQPHSNNSVPPTLSRPVWHSRLCVPLFTLLGLIVTLAVTALWGRSLMSASPYYTLVSLLGLGSLALIVLLYSRIQHNLIRPLTQLRQWAQSVSAGSLSSRLSVSIPGEFASLAVDINKMTDTLQSLSEDMQSQVRAQTRHIEQKTRSLEIIYDVAASINVSRDLDDLLTRFLHTLKDVVNARAAVVRLATDDNQMRLVASTGLSKEVVEREQILPATTCLCGSAYTEGKVLFQEDISQCDKIIGHSFFNGENIGMIAVPLQYRDRTLGVYNLFVEHKHQVDRNDVTDLLTSIGRHLGMAIDKARLDDETNRLSIMEERTRIAHELHDSLAQTLASLRFQVRVLDETLRQGKEQDTWYELEQIENNLDEAYAELRELITHFRAPVDSRGLVPAVQHLVDRFRKQTHTHIFLQKEWNLVQLPPSIEVQVLRIIQEALNNIRKHSQASYVRVLMRSDPQGNCRILIEDDGVGIAGPNRDGNDHYGLSIMQERARNINGELKIESEQGEGTQVMLQFQHPGHSLFHGIPNSVTVQPPIKRLMS